LQPLVESVLSLCAPFVPCNAMRLPRNAISMRQDGDGRAGGPTSYDVEHFLLCDFASSAVGIEDRTVDNHYGAGTNGDSDSGPPSRDLREHPFHGSPAESVSSLVAIPPLYLPDLSLF
jgi:hypothetical protein